MANERLFIRCPKCQEVVYLAKCMGSGWYTANEPGIGERFERFVDEHFFCGHANGENCPELRYEGDFNRHYLVTDMATGKRKNPEPAIKTATDGEDEEC